MYTKKFSKNKTKENLELMKTWRNRATLLRRRAIKEYWNAISIDMNNNPRKFYNTFTPFLNSKTKDNSAISLNIRGVIQQDQGLVAQEFTNNFCSIADHIGGPYACNITENDCDLHRSALAINAKHTPNTFKFRKLKRQEVLAALKEINPNKAAGYDMLPARVLKIAAEQLATPLTTHFQSGNRG